MGADGLGGGSPTAPKQLNSVADIARADDAVAQTLENAENAHPMPLSSPGAYDAAIQSTMRSEVAAYAQNQYQQLLADDLDTQAAPGFSGHNYSSYTATQIKQMMTTNMDPATAGDAASGWNDIGNKYVTVAQGLGQAASGSEYGWQGTAGDATRDFINGVAKWAGTAGQGAQLAGNRLAVQSEAAATAKNSVPTNPVEPPTAQDVASTMLRGGGNPIFGAMQLNAQFQQAAADHAVAVLAAQTYDTSLASAGEKFPAFNAPPTFSSGSGGGASLPPAGGAGISGLGAGGNVPRAIAGAVRGSAAGSGASGSSGGSGFGGVASRAPVTSSSASSASSAPGAPNLSTGQSGFDPGGMTNLPGTTNPGVDVPSQGAGWSQGGGSGDPTFSGSLLGELGPVGGGGLASGGPGSGGPRGLSGGAVGAREGGVGARSGIGSGLAAEEGEGAGGVRAAAAGEPGEPGMVPPRGQGKGGKDTEHKRASYLLNPDPDATFGPDGLVTPPVIGE